MQYSSIYNKSLASLTAGKSKNDTAAEAEAIIPIVRLRLTDKHNLYIRNDEGLRGIGKFLPIVEIFIDSNKRLQVRYRTRDKSEGASTYGYAIIGKLQVIEEGGNLS